MRLVWALVLLFASQPLWAKYDFGFGNVSLNYLDWDKGTENKSTKKDFSYLEIEGGSQFSWGELYGFFDLENPGRSGDEIRTASKASIRYYLGSTGFSLYAHEYSFHSLGFSDQNRVVGMGYQWVGEKWWFKPFFGYHEVSQTFYSGANGYMMGWIAGYGFSFAEKNFLLTQWHEIEIDRNEAYANGNGDSKASQNGAIGAWMDIRSDLTVGLQMRYAQDKLGTAGKMSASIWSLKYNF